MDSDQLAAEGESRVEPERKETNSDTVRREIVRLRRLVLQIAERLDALKEQIAS